MKRALLIAGGTVGGLGAVLAITPPQLSTSELNIAGGAAIGSSTGTSTAANASSSSTNSAAADTAPAKATAKATASAKATATAAAKSSTSNSTSSNTAADTTATPAAKATATPVATKAAAATTSAKGVNGTFTGPAVFVNYGNVQVKITVVNGKITDAVAVQAPSGRNDRWTNMAVPILKQQTLAAQSANIQGASGASYTSYGWYKSLQGALADAGL